MPQDMGAPAMLAPAPMPPQAGGAMPQVEQGLMAAEQQGQKLGQEYGALTMQALDSAETPKELIDAMRGNERPLEARYAELASLVGPEDARATPESVLALVQPTIMMTEQGALDSGMGELMRSVIGDVDMEDEMGQPTQMGQGVGSLMMAGVGQQPVANFSQGGAVQRFQEGGEASRLQQLYAEMLPVYQGILGDGSEQQRMARSQILFDIADRAGAFAAGIDPRTGRSVAGLSPMAQLGAATSGLGGQIGERLAGVQEQERALQLAALQAAQGEYSAERAAARASRGDRALGNFYDILDADGNLVDRVPLGTQADYAAVQDRIPAGGSIQPSRFDTEGDFVTLIDPNNPMNIQQVRQGSSAESQARTMGFVEPAVASTLRELTQDPDRDVRIIGGNAVDLTDPENPVVVYQSAPERDLRSVNGAVVDVTDPENPVVVYRGAAERDLRTVDNRVIDFTNPDTPVVLYAPDPAAPSGNVVNVQLPDGTVRSLREDDPQLDALLANGATRVSATQAQTTSPLVDVDLMGRYAAGETTPQEEAIIQSEIAQSNRPTWNAATGSFEAPAITPIIRNAEEARRAAGLETAIPFPEEGGPSEAGLERNRNLAELGGNAFGTRAFLAELANTAFAIVDANAPASATQEGVDAVNALNQDALIAFRSLLVGRPAQDAVNQFATLLPNPATISGSPGSAASEIRQVIGLYRSNISAAEDMLRSTTLSQGEKNELRRAIVDAQRMIDSYDSLLMGIQQGPRTTSGVDPAAFRR